MTYAQRQSIYAKLPSNCYTAEERTYLRRHFADKSNQEIAEALGRTEGGVRKMARKMCLEKSAAYRAATRAGNPGGGRRAKRHSVITVEGMGRLGNVWFRGVSSVFSLASKFQE